MAIETRASAEVRKKLTPEDVAGMLKRGEIDPHERWFELINGELIDVPPAGPDHNWKTGNIFAALHLFAKTHGGQAFTDGAGFLVGRDRRQLRSPDAAYLAPEQIVKPPIPTWIPGAPDLAVEVLSGDQYGEPYAAGKVQEYLDAGAQLVWLVDRRKQEVRVFRAGSDEIVVMRADALLTLEPIISGFALAVSDIFS
ncbi:MAG: Uma2 family endonuclease [Chloroflexi bacterium]|nr:Uma2 family endonuclease [Chloroflexota bacterium]